MSIDISLCRPAWNGFDANTPALVDSWLVPAGTHVSEGDVLARVLLINDTCEFTAPESGLLENILVPAGKTFVRGQALARLRTG